MNGKYIIIYLNGTAIAGTKSDDVQSTADLTEVSSSNYGQWKTYVAEMKSWSVTVNTLVSSVGVALEDLLKIGNTYTLVFGATGQTGQNIQGLTGTAILKSCRINSVVGSLVNGTFVFQGSGDLTQTTTPS